MSRALPRCCGSSCEYACELIKPKGTTSCKTMPGCSAYGCSNRSGSGDLSYFRFPIIANPQLCLQWARNCGQIVRANPLIQWAPTKSSVLCSAHFEESCFELDCRYLMEGKPGFPYPSKRRRAMRLKPGSVPTLFEHTRSETKTNPAPEKAITIRITHAEVPVSTGNSCHGNAQYCLYVVCVCVH